MKENTAPLPANGFFHYVCFIAVLALFVGTSMLILGQSLAPSIISLIPNSRNAGGPNFTLTVNGSALSSSLVYWSGSPRTTTFVSTTQLTAAIPASDLTYAGTYGVTAINSFGQTSNTASFSVLPAISLLNPQSATVGGSGFTLVVNGAGFICDGDEILWNGSPRPITSCTNTQLAASIPASDIASAGGVSITVQSNQLLSSPATFSILNPEPVIGSLIPALVPTGFGAFTLVVNGSGFVPNSTIRLNGVPYTTTFVNSNRVTAPIPETITAAAGSFPVTVVSPAPGGGISNTATFTVSTQLSFSYSFSGQSAVPVLPGGTIAFPTTDVGGANVAQVQISNTGSSPTTINSISQSSTSFALSGVPGLPATLPPNGNLAFALSFLPTAAGSIQGSLTVDGTSFVLTGTAIVSPLTYRYTLPNSSPVSISPGGTIPFPSVVAGGSSSAQLQIVNQSSGSASVSAITSSSSLFTLGAVPTFPVTIPAGGSLDLGLTFRPTTPGSSTATLTVGTRTFSLTGIGLTSGVSLTGLTDVVPPAQQPRVGVELTSATSVPLIGQLVLTFTPTADVPSDDPAVQFATGGRSVNFTVAVNGTKSDFGGSPDIPFSTGTVAGTLRLAVTLRNAGTDVTPTTPDPNRTVTVERRAPSITSVSLASRTTSGFEVVIVGYSTTRSLSQAAFRFAPRTGSNVQNADVTVNVTNQFTTWYESTDSQQFGSQFRLRIPFTVQGDINALGSVSVTLTNSAGTSQPASTSF